MANARMRVRAAQNFCPKRSDQIDVRGVNRATANFIAPLVARHGCADYFEFRHRYLSFFRSRGLDGMIFSECFAISTPNRWTSRLSAVSEPLAFYHEDHEGHEEF